MVMYLVAMQSAFDKLRADYSCQFETSVTILSIDKPLRKGSETAASNPGLQGSVGEKREETFVCE
jgi:hypothetical protein